MAAIKHPCVGDPLYGADPVLARRLGLERQWLHAMGLGFEHPGSGRMGHLRDRPTPADLDEALDRLAAAG
jgi:23S rRNA pseudouridine1911/1915/1917 synthase